MGELHLDIPVENTSVFPGITFFRDGYGFSSLNGPANVYDAIVIRNPEHCDCWTPKYSFSQHSLSEHIEFINRHQLAKAVVIAEDIEFITQCPSLSQIWVLPADTAKDQFDFSPLYKMPQIQYLRCETIYGGNTLKKKSSIDCSYVHSLEELELIGTGTKCFEKISTLKRLRISERKDFRNIFSIANNSHLHSLELFRCGVENLNGLELFPEIRTLEFTYCRKLLDVTALKYVSNSLKTLTIENCPRITNFEFLRDLNSLENLMLIGSNCLETLDFLRCMPHLKRFVFDMDVANGDLTPCMQIPDAVCLKNRRHFNLKDSQLPHSPK